MGFAIKRLVALVLSLAYIFSSIAILGMTAASGNLPIFLTAFASIAIVGFVLYFFMHWTLRLS